MRPRTAPQRPVASPENLLLPAVPALGNCLSENRVLTETPPKPRPP